MSDDEQDASEKSKSAQQKQSRACEGERSTFRRARLSRRDDAAGRRREPHFRPLRKKQQRGRRRRSDEEGDIRAAGKGRRRGRKGSSFSGQITAPSRNPFAAFPSSSSPSHRSFFFFSTGAPRLRACGSRRLPPPARRPSKRRRNLSLL